MPSRIPRTRRPPWWAELPLVAAVYALYSAGRLLTRGDVTDAVRHGVSMLRLEEGLGLNWESGLNTAFSQYPWLGVPADFAYASLHYLVTPAVLVWLYRRRPANYRALRTWLLCATLLSLVGFLLLPTSPPRLLGPAHGFLDTMAQYANYGWWGGEASAPRGVGALTNQFAAMPSLHVGWALWCGAVLWRYGPRSWLVRAGAVGYPAGVAVVVLGTGNHYLLDVLAGAVVLALGLLMTRPALQVVELLRRRLRLGSAAPVAARPVAATDAGGAVPDGDAVPAGGARSAGGATAVGTGCQTSGRICQAAISREGTADEHFPGPRDEAGERSAPPAR